MPRHENGQVVTVAAAYKPRLDLLWDIFGGHQVVFGSDWPNSAASRVEAEECRRHGAISSDALVLMSPNLLNASLLGWNTGDGRGRHWARETAGRLLELFSKLHGVTWESSKNRAADWSRYR